MPNRIEAKFKQLRSRKKKAFIAYITAGFPDLKTTEELVVAFANAGVDIVELGVPFSDPMADGPTIQASSAAAIEGGTTIPKIFSAVERIRRQTEIPIALMTYYNPVFHYGEAKFIKEAKKCGVDGIIIPDLPLEEARSLIHVSRRSHMATVFFLAPTTAKTRISKIAQASTGFIYYVSLTGVTGGRAALPQSVFANVKAAKSFTDKPVCVGFGVSTPQQVKAIGKVADGVIVGSVIIKEIQKNLGKAYLVKNVAGFVKNLAKAV